MSDVREQKRSSEIRHLARSPLQRAWGHQTRRFHQSRAAGNHRGRRPVYQQLCGSDLGTWLGRTVARPRVPRRPDMGVDRLPPVGSTGGRTVFHRLIEEPPLPGQSAHSCGRARARRRDSPTVALAFPARALRRASSARVGAKWRGVAPLRLRAAGGMLPATGSRPDIAPPRPHRNATEGSSGGARLRPSG